ncbi:hypothetical protein [Mycobacterium sp.]|uniref:hypothetical protein n=1 Tax=Mycobacterium sp. TaxID=1785 RepID=UPI003A8AEE47
MSPALRPGWMVALCAAIMWAGAWMPWLTTQAGGGGRANGIGGAHGSLELPHGFGVSQLIVLLASALLVVGAMVGRGLSVRGASVAALVISSVDVALVALYYQRNINGPVSAGYGLYVVAAAGVGAGVCALWATVAALLGGRSRR